MATICRQLYVTPEYFDAKFLTIVNIVVESLGTVMAKTVVVASDEYFYIQLIAQNLLHKSLGR